MAFILLRLFGTVSRRSVMTLFGWLVALLAGIFKVCTAHTLLIGLLLLSGGTNFFFSSRDTFKWWNERNAGKFMSRIGIGPSLSMSRAIHLRDIDDLFGNHTSFAEDSDNKWYIPFPYSLNKHLLIHPKSSNIQRSPNDNPVIRLTIW